MKTLIDGLIVSAVVVTVIGAVSRLNRVPFPIAGLESRAFAGFAVVLLLLAISLQLRKQ